VQYITSDFDELTTIEQLEINGGADLEHRGTVRLVSAGVATDFERFFDPTSGQCFFAAKVGGSMDQLRKGDYNGNNLNSQTYTYAEASSGSVPDTGEKPMPDE